MYFLGKGKWLKYLSPKSPYKGSQYNLSKIYRLPFLHEYGYIEAAMSWKFATSLKGWTIYSKVIIKHSICKRL